MDTSILIGLLLVILIAIIVGLASLGRRRDLKEVARLQHSIDSNSTNLATPSRTLSPASVLDNAVRAVADTPGEWRVEEVADHYVIVVRKHRVPHLGYAIASLPLGGIPIVLWIIDSARDKWRYRFMILYGKGLRAEISRL